MIRFIGQRYVLPSVYPCVCPQKKTLIHIGPFFSIPPGESLFPTTVSPDSRGNEILLYHYSTKHTNRRQDVASPDSVSILLRAQISRRVLLNHLQEDSGPQPASRAERSPCHSIWQSYNFQTFFKKFSLKISVFLPLWQIARKTPLQQRLQTLRACILPFAGSLRNGGDATTQSGDAIDCAPCLGMCLRGCLKIIVKQPLRIFTPSGISAGRGTRRRRKGNGSRRRARGRISCAMRRHRRRASGRS